MKKISLLCIFIFLSGSIALYSCGSAKINKLGTPRLHGIIKNSIKYSSLTASVGGQWLTYQQNNQRTGVDAVDSNLAPTHAAWTSPILDGGLYAQPLVYNSLIIAATQNDTVYALNTADGAIAWSNHLGAPVPASWLPCGNIDPVGIISTPVIDPSNNELFVVGDIQGPNNSAIHEMWTLNALTGQLLATRVVDVPGMDTLAQLQRAGLTLANGYVYIGFGGNYGDCGNYHGYVVGAPESGTGSIIYYQVSTQNEGAIWSPAGESVDPSGNIFAATGNGSSTTTYDEGNSVLKLSPSMSLLSYFAPTNWAQDNLNDADLGSMTPVLLPGGYAFQVGKEYQGYLLNTQALGGIGGQLAEVGVCFAIGGGEVVSGSNIFVPCSDGIQEVSWSVNPPSLSLGWKAASQVIGPPILAGGLLWSIDWQAGTLYSLNPATGAIVSQFSLGSVEHFAAPSAGDGLILVGTSNSVKAFSGSPEIQKISPSSGPMNSQITTTIYGQGFSNATSVTFGAQAAVSFTVVNDSEISAIAPSSSLPGLVNVSVTTPNGTSTQTGNSGFLYIAPGSFFGEKPVRICDTRPNAQDPPTYANHTLGPNSSITINVVNANSDNVPSNASSVILNLTAVHPSAVGYLTAWPAGLSMPNSSSLNFAPNENAIATMAEIPIGASGQISIYNSSGTTDLLVDVEGWVAPTSSTAGLFNSLGPQRIADTRNYVGNNYQGASKTLQPGQSINIAVGGYGGIPSYISGAILNITATNTSSNGGYLIAYPTGSPMPNSSIINFDKGQTIANRAELMVSTNGYVTITAEVSSVDVIIDVTGFFTGTTGVTTGYRFNPLSPVRIVDTRNYSQNPYQDAGKTLVPNNMLAANATLSDGVPSTAVAICGTITATNTQQNGGYVTIWPYGTQMPKTSDLNWMSGETIANMVVVSIGTNSQISIESEVSSADILIDITGWFG